MYPLLSRLHAPADLRRFSVPELEILAAEIRAFLVEKVSRSGGHLGPNLGVVELTIALHRVFESPRDALLFDTGHQSYVHKLVTGRTEGFDTLRQEHGLSGYPSREESEHDVIENSHASTALSWADGLASAWQLRGELGNRHVVAVIGDGAMTGGMAWEAINNIAAKQERPLVVVVNDNGRSYAPTAGALASHLAALRASRGYEALLAWGKRTLLRIPLVGRPAFRGVHALKLALGDLLLDPGMFHNLGLKYIGPVPGHDLIELERALRIARDFGGPSLVHVITEKGKGYELAERDEADKFHGIGAIDPVTGAPRKAAARSWTDAFSDALIEVGGPRPEVVAITAAMLAPAGLAAFAERFPDRVFDVGIAEQHAVTSAAGMAYGGLHPVFAVYATFLNRAYDQLLMDCALHGAAVTFALDRAGVTGDDGASHNGMWDFALLRTVPGLRMYAPRDAKTLRDHLADCLDHTSGPSVIRYPKGSVPEEVAVVADQGGHALLRAGSERTAVVAAGSFAELGLSAAEASGRDVAVYSLTQVLPIPAVMVAELQRYDRVLTIEDGLVEGGVGEELAASLHASGAATVVKNLGVPREFLAHGSRAQVLERIGLTAERLGQAVADF